MHHAPMLSPEQATFFLRKILTMFDRSAEPAEVKAKHRMELGIKFAMTRQVIQWRVPAGQRLCSKACSSKVYSDFDETLLSTNSLDSEIAEMSVGLVVPIGRRAFSRNCDRRINRPTNQHPQNQPTTRRTNQPNHPSPPTN